MSTRKTTAGIAATAAVLAAAASSYLYYMNAKAKKSSNNKEKLLNAIKERATVTTPKEDPLSDLVHVIDSPESVESFVQNELEKVSRVPVVGFDCEWFTPQNFTKGAKAKPPGKISLIQLAIPQGNCYLFRISKLGFEIPDFLVKILANENITKLGVGIEDDSKKVFNDFGVNVKSWVDLRHRARTLKPDLRRTGLAGLALAFVGVNLDKNWRIRAGNWEADVLQKRMLEYAANDALIAVNIGLVMTLLHTQDCDGIETKTDLSESLSETMSCFREIHFVAKNPPCEKRKGGEGGKRSQRKKVEAQNKAINKKITEVKEGVGKSKERKLPTRKTPLYHNAQLEAPDGQPLCVCDVKKAEWYILKGLGRKIKDDPFTVRLNFEPSGRPEGKAGEYYLTFKENLCVVCGAEDSYSRKYVVPREYRTHFPEVMRDHQSHDVLLMCGTCHQTSNLHDLILRRQLAEECDAPIGTEDDVKVREDFALKQVRSAARALLHKNAQNIPEERVEELKQILLDYYDAKEVTEDVLKKGANVEANVLNEGYKPHGLKVVEYFQSNENGGLCSLEVRWRKHFLATMQPKFLPELWSVDHQQERLDYRAAEKRIDPNDYKKATQGI